MTRSKLFPIAGLALGALAFLVPSSSDATLVKRTVFCEEFGFST
jgi:hypothetical protein